ncbi:putative cytochrome c assembly protein [Medicago truncatula]|nr:putative cytochrome c assembly protein [Medicago truncatula]
MKQTYQISNDFVTCGSLLSVAILVITFQEAIQILTFTKNLDFLNKSVDFVEIKYMNMNERNNGFLFLTICILSGAVWTNEACGSYWNWDPKETWAFITWTIFAIYSHTRKNKKFEGVNSSIVASIGFLIIWICYLGINLLGI